MDWHPVQGKLCSQLLALQKPEISTGLISHIGPSMALPFYHFIKFHLNFPN